MKHKDIFLLSLLKVFFKSRLWLFSRQIGIVIVAADISSLEIGEKVCVVGEKLNAIRALLSFIPESL